MLQRCWLYHKQTQKEWKASLFPSTLSKITDGTVDTLSAPLSPEEENLQQELRNLSAAVESRLDALEKGITLLHAQIVGKRSVSNSLHILLHCRDVCLNLNARAAAILLTASDMHNRGFVEGGGHVARPLSDSKIVTVYPVERGVITA
jgi:hypothetical protein